MYHSCLLLLLFNPGSRQGSHIIFSYHDSLNSFHLEQVPPTFLILRDIDISEEARFVVPQNVLSLDGLVVSLVLDLR